MRTPFSIPGFIGLAASALAVVLWTIEQLTGQAIFELIAIPFKLVVLAAPLFFLSDLSTFLHRRPRIAISLGFVLIATTVCAMLAYLPWRSSFAEHFNNAVYRWYYDGMPTKEGDFGDWQTAWARRVPHVLEAGLLSVYYIAIIAVCTIRRLCRLGGAIVALAGYLLLCLFPVFSGLILWDYDTFLKGIAFDSISMDLVPIYFWRSGDYSIFLYAFMLIFFGATATFFYVTPRNAA